MAIIDKKITPKFAVVSVNAIADNQIVAAVTDKKIRVLSYVLNAAGGANTCTWKKATTAISGAMDIGNDVTVQHENDRGVFETGAGQALNLAITAATLVAGHITYIEV